MGHLNLILTMGRISVATKSSPIAVFRCSEPGRLRSVFAATSESRRVIHLMLAEPASDLIGVFDRDMDEEKVAKILQRHIGRPTQ